MNNMVNYHIQICTIQYISAKMPEIHSYLKSYGWNKQDYAFFICHAYDEVSQCLGECMLMLCPSGEIYFLQPEGDSYSRVTVTNQCVIDNTVMVLQQEVNSRHPYLKQVLETYLASTGKGSTSSYQPLF